MRALILLRHSLTEANERRLYCGSGDPPLSPAGRALALARRREWALGAFDLAVTSGLRRTDETLLLLTGRRADAAIPALAETNFGAFEGRSHEALKELDAYQRWINDDTGGVAPPDGESRNAFRRRVFSGGETLLGMRWKRAVAVTHGGVIVQLMGAWFPEERRGFYDWQPEPCGGYRVAFDGDQPTGFEVL